MKKRLVKFAAAVSAAAILTLAGCSNTPDFNVSSEIDTVLNLAKPEVNVTAYPGMNYVSWAPVANANGYVLYIYEDGNHIRTQNSIAYSTLNYTDTAIQNNKTYKYIVEAVSKTSTGRAVVTENSLSNPVSVKAVVPSYETSPLELYKFETGSKNAEYVVSAEKIKAYKDSDSSIGIDFPAKAYLNYAVSYSINNEYEVYENTRSISTSLSNKASNDTTLHSSISSITTSGTYHFIVDASAANTKYGKKDRVIANATVEVENLAGSGAAITSAAYKTDDTVRVVFTGFTLADGTLAPADYYKVYRSTSYAPTLYTPVSGDVTASISTANQFFVEDSIEDKNVAYIYTLVVTDGTRYASITADMKKNLASKSDKKFTAPTVQTNVSTLDKDGRANDIEWTITLPETEITINSIYYMEKKTSETYTVVAADFNKADEYKVEFTPAANTTGTVYKAFTKNHNAKTTVYLLVSLSKEGYVDAEFVIGGYTINDRAITTPTFTALLYDNKVDGATPADYVLENNDVVLNIKDNLYDDEFAANKYTYAIYEANPEYVITTDSITWNFDTADWKPSTETIELKKNTYNESTTLNQYVAVIQLSDLVPDTYAWKLVKTETATGKVISTIIRYVVVNGPAADAIKFTPYISASKNNSDVKVSDIYVQFTKANTFKRVYGTGLLANYVVNCVPEAPEAGVTYTLYRTTLVGNAQTTKVIWEKVDSVSQYNPYSTTVSFYELDENDNPVVKETKSVTSSLVYGYTDKGLSTGDGYSYIVISEKENCEPVYSNVYTITPVN